MIIDTPAIVLNTFPYGETSLISRCFTKEKGKVSFIIKGAQSKKNLIAPYFQPLSFIQTIYNESEKRDLQIISKVNFIKVWLKISQSLKKMTLLQSILEITDRSLEINDPHPRLFESLIEVIELYENNSINSILAFWFYETVILSEMGFRIDLDDNGFESIGFGSLNFKNEKQCRYILQNLINKNFEKISFEKILHREKKLISRYLYRQLCYHIEGFDRIKSFKVAKNILNDL
tara:strand:- start:863 stop:1561 length:699 start_codon:yes stop_codon:yes gene_type:complete